MKNRKFNEIAIRFYALSLFRLGDARKKLRSCEKKAKSQRNRDLKKVRFSYNLKQITEVMKNN